MRTSPIAPFAVSAALRASRRWRRAPVRRTTAALASPTNGPDEFASVTSRVHIAKTPQTFEHDLDGNQTLVTTKTGTWRVTYNGENRPIRWMRINAAGTNDQTTISMNFDRQGRRRLYLETAADGTTNRLDRFTYDNYLCIARNRWQPDGTSAADRFTWDPTEPVATRPLAWNYSTLQPFNVSTCYYAHDGNKNVSELVSVNNGTITAHYEYASFGDMILTFGDRALANPFRFSSEYSDDALGLVYYNYRHLEPVTGRWLQRDMIEENGGVNLYRFLNNKFIRFDFLGLDDKCSAIGNFNVLSIMISINPAEREFDQRSVINAANDLLERLEEIGFYSGTAGLGEVNEILRLIYNGARYAEGLLSKHNDLIDDGLGSSIDDFLNQYLNGLFRIDGRLKYQLCLCVNGELRFVTQSDIKGTEDVDFSNAYDAVLYRNAVNDSIKNVEKDLLQKLAEKVKDSRK